MSNVEVQMSETAVVPTKARSSITITESGVYDLDSDTYHADPAITPSLSAGMINDLLLAPAKCFYNNKRLNPDWEAPDDENKFTIGTVAHVMFLEPKLFAEKVVVLPFDDWRKNAAKDARDKAKAEGKTAILVKHMEKIEAARNVFLSDAFTRQAFANGQFEKSLFWKHPKYGFWCRCRPDFFADSLAHINDYKTTTNADPSKFGKHAYELGYHRRAAWYLSGFEEVFGKRPEHYWFVNQEVKAPHLTSVCELDINALEAGAMENDLACQIFDRCLQTGDWYGYRHRHSPNQDQAFRISLPNWAYVQIDERI